MSPGTEETSLAVRPYGPGDAETWDALVDASRCGHFMFRRAYMDYHADRFEDCSLLVFDGERAVAALPASRDGDVVTSHAGLTFGGLVSGAALTTRRTLLALTAVRDHYAAQGARELVYKAVPHIYHRVPAEEDLYALTALGATLVRRDVASAVRPNERPAPSKGRRSSVRQGERAGVTVEQGTDFRAFMALETAMLERRHGVGAVHSGEEMELLASRFPDEIALHVARRDGELLAGVVVYETPTVAHAQYIGATAAGHEIHALDVVIEHLIADRYAGKRFFDFGISTEDEGRVLNEGLARNKESFGARAVVYDRYALSLAAHGA